MIPALTLQDWLPDFDPVLDVLPEPGFVVLPGFLPAALVTALRAELRALDSAGRCHAAGIGRGAAHQLQTQIRGDRIVWLEPGWTAAACYLAGMDMLRQRLNRECFLGLAEYEAHYACYEPGAGYHRHVDRHAGTPGAPGQGQRVISTVCYLNEPGWPAQAGGELLLCPADGEPVRILPEAGTLVVFRSDSLPHEVLAASRQRLSIAGWMRTRD